MIKKTNKYSAFKLLNRNRKLYESHLKKLKKSIEEDNRLEENPIIVNEKMEIIDGQHRLAVAKQLDIPIYYIVSKSADMETVMRLQTQKTWSLNDYIDSYIKAGNTYYIVLKDFINYYGLPITFSADLLSGKTSFKGGSGGKVIKSGDFEIKNLKSAKDFADKYREIYQKIRKPFARTRDFVVAVVTITGSELYSQDRMTRKLKYYARRLSPKPTYTEYARDLEDIYNLKEKGERVRLF